MENKRRTVVVIAAIAVLIMITAVVLFAMGRTPLYTYGPPEIWSGDTVSNQNSQQLADPYTFTHVLHGIGFFVLLWLVARRLPLGIRIILAIAIESAWEIFENTSFVIERYRAATISLDYYGDSILNSVGDIFTAAIGFWLAYKLPIWATVAVVLLLEAVLAWWIRDSLILNMIMLVYPIEAIRNWQMGG
ncbi:MAG: DUF2585 family protein [Parcubacteria group bacterium]|nr:DUF2585 family protein [Parcubacteria group bacterium]